MEGVNYENDRVAYLETTLDAAKALRESSCCPASLFEAEGLILYCEAELKLLNDPIGQ